MPQSQGGSGASEHTSCILLQYPTLPVVGTPATWLSHSQLAAMASNPDYSASDDTASSLGDSTYDFVDDKSGIVSDDEDHENLTPSVSSNEERELPQVNRLLHQSATYDCEASASYQSTSFSRSLSEAHSLPTGSGLTIRGPHTGDETNQGLFTGHRNDTEDVIVLHEPSIINRDSDKPFESECTLKVFDQNEASEVTMHHARATLPSTILTAVVKQTMVKQQLIPQNPYKVLFVGDPSTREEIVWKIGSALDAAPSSEDYFPNQYAVVRIPSFEDAAARGVELIDSTGINLIIEECSSASFTKVDGGNDTISMAISNQVSSDQKLVESVWSGSGHKVTDNWSLPDIAVFYLSESESILAKQTRHFARKFMSRHQVPCIVISQAPLWNRPAEIIALDYTTLHICLKAHDSSTSIVKRLPVNLKTFMSLDASQMNRNLAYLASRHTSSKLQTLRPPISKQETFTDLHVPEKGDYSSRSFLYIKKSLSSKHLSSLNGLFLPSLLLVLGLLLYQIVMPFAVGAPYVPARQEKGLNIVTNIQRACAKFGPMVPSSLQSDSALIPNPVSSLIHKTSEPKGKSPLASNSALASFLHGREDYAPNKSEKFEVGVIGDCHIVLRSPRWFIRAKKTPKLAFNVTRKGSVLHHQVSMPFDGVYALEIPKDDAYGTLNVSLWTTSKPTINESFEVELGTSWLKASTWNRATRVISSSFSKNRDLVLASVMGQYRGYGSNVGSLLAWRIGKVDEARQEARKASKASPNQASKTADLSQRKTMDSLRKLLLRVCDGSKVAALQMHLQAQQVRRDITGHFTTRSLPLREETQRLSHAVAGNLRKIAYSVARSQSSHLRTTQKEALKFWWKIRGLPRQESSKSVEQGKPPAQNGKSPRKLNR